MENNIIQYILAVLIFVILLLIILTFIIRKKEEKLTDSFGKEYVHSISSHDTDNIKKEEKENMKFNSKNTSFKNLQKLKNEFNIKKNKSPKLNLLINILILLGALYFISKAIIFISFISSESLNYNNFISKLNSAIKYIFVVIGIYGILTKKKEGIFLTIISFLRPFSNTFYFLNNIIIWIFTGKIFKKNYTIKFASFIGIILEIINVFIYAVTMRAENFSFIGQVQLNPSFVMMINLLWILQSVLFFFGLLIEKKR